jgi:glycosyltransferase involved in cell wall biosynthesis
MRMAVLTGSLSRLAGGTFASIKRPMQELVRQVPIEMGVFGIEDRYSAEDLPEWHPLAPRVFRRVGPAAFGWAPGMLAAVKRFRPDLIQVHGIWMHYSAVSAAMYRKRRVPHMVHLHGMLDQWAVRGSQWRKRCASWAYEGAHLRRAACLRALCEGEVRAIRDFGIRGRICLIPNGIDLPVERTAGPAPWAADVRPGRKVLLFLSRIHAKKGLVSLITAWSRLRVSDRQLTDEWELVIAGWDTTGHEVELQQQVEELGLDSVHFVGPLFNEAKDQAFRNAAAFVLPSLSEGLPMTILEAWAYSLPVVMTPQCNLPVGFDVEAAIRVDPESSSLERGLRLLLQLSGEDRAKMGARGRRLVGERFRWDAIARQMHEVNLWILGGGPPPSFVL